MIGWGIVVAVAACLTVTLPPLFAEETGRNEAVHLVVGTEHDYPPFSFLDEKGKPTGFNIDLTHAVAEATGLRVEMDYRPWDEIRKDLEHGKIHAIAGMFHSAERELEVDFSPPFAVITHAVFVRKQSGKIESEEELKDKEIIVVQGDIMHEYAVEKNLSQHLVTVQDPAEALRRLASGRHDCALVAKLPGLYWVKALALSNIVLAGPPLRPSKYCYAVKEGNEELLFRLNEGLALVMETGEYRELYEKWLGVLEPTEISTTIVLKYLKYLAAVIIPLFLIAAGSALWSWSLRRQVAQRTNESARELTERKRIEEALRERENFLDSLIHAIPIPVFYKDAAGRYLGFNHAFEAFFGETKERLIGKTVFDISPEELAKRYHAKDTELIEHHGIQQYESQVKTAGGALRDVVFHKSVFLDGRGGTAGLIGAVIDITERKQTEQEREKLIRELRDALQEVKTLSGLLPICSHCKKIRDDKGYWKKIETYIQEHSEARFSHGICQDCAKKYYPDIDIY